MDIEDIKVEKIETRKQVKKDDGALQIQHEVIEYTDDQQQEETKQQ